MSTQHQSLAVKPAAQVDLSPQTFEQALTFSNYLADSDLVPKDFKGKPGNCLIAMQWGAELGLKPLQALQNLAIINGRPALWGDAVIALVRSSHLCEYVIEEDDGNTATCKVKRRGEPEQIRTFSMKDAALAGLAGKAGPWTQHPKRMRQMRARSFALRDVFPDVLRGIPVAEEVMDFADTPKAIDPATGEIQPKPVARPELQPYPQADLEKNLPSWQAVIQSGRKTPEQLIAMASTKGVLSEAQKKAIRNLAVVDMPEKEPEPAADVSADHAEFIADME